MTLRFTMKETAYAGQVVELDQATGMLRPVETLKNGLPPEPTAVEVYREMCKHDPITKALKASVERMFDEVLERAIAQVEEEEKHCPACTSGIRGLHHSTAVDENGCHTTPDGSCVSSGPCFHTSRQAIWWPYGTHASDEECSYRGKLQFSKLADEVGDPLWERHGDGTLCPAKDVSASFETNTLQLRLDPMRPGKPIGETFSVPSPPPARPDEHLIGEMEKPASKPVSQSEERHPFVGKTCEHGYVGPHSYMPKPPRIGVTAECPGPISENSRETDNA